MLLSPLWPGWVCLRYRMHLVLLLGGVGLQLLSGLKVASYCCSRSFLENGRLLAQVGLRWWLGRPYHRAGCCRWRWWWGVWPSRGESTGVQALLPLRWLCGLRGGLFLLDRSCCRDTVAHLGLEVDVNVILVHGSLRRQRRPPGVCRRCVAVWCEFLRFVSRFCRGVLVCGVWTRPSASAACSSSLSGKRWLLQWAAILRADV